MSSTLPTLVFNAMILHWVESQKYPGTLFCSIYPMQSWESTDKKPTQTVSKLKTYLRPEKQHKK